MDPGDVEFAVCDELKVHIYDNHYNWWCCNVDSSRL